MVVVEIIGYTVAGGHAVPGTAQNVIKPQVPDRRPNDTSQRGIDQAIAGVEKRLVGSVGIVAL